MVSFILFIIATAVIALFAGFNLSHTCDVSVIFHTFKSVPVFITIIISFVAGVLVTLPFAIFRKPIFSKKKAKANETKNLENTNENSTEKKR